MATWPQTLDVAPDNVKLTMSVYTASVGRTCVGCHEGGKWAATDEASEVVTLMNRLFPVMNAYLPEGAQTQCFMCHKGRPHPERAPR